MVRQELYGVGINFDFAKADLVDKVRKYAEGNKLVAPENPISAGSDYVVSLRADHEAYKAGIPRPTVDAAYRAALESLNLTPKQVDPEKYRIRVAANFEFREAGASGAAPTGRGLRDISRLMV